MFKGKTTMTVSEATLILAVQHYFDGVVFHADGSKPKVIRIVTEMNGMSGSGFVITLDQPDDPLPAKGAL